MSGDRILWNRRPKNSRDTGDIDEIVAHNEPWPTDEEHR